mmetsp:Transcript_78409/g.123567  ORF Transcript_78409/g.123567 Transcript_78409/m.123567 type:complete len:211 (-) Transcript_78409:796-1428(-)
MPAPSLSRSEASSAFPCSAALCKGVDLQRSSRPTSAPFFTSSLAKLLCPAAALCKGVARCLSCALMSAPLLNSNAPKDPCLKSKEAAKCNAVSPCASRLSGETLSPKMRRCEAFNKPCATTSVRELSVSGFLKVAVKRKGRSPSFRGEIVEPPLRAAVLLRSPPSTTACTHAFRPPVRRISAEQQSNSSAHTLPGCRNEAPWSLRMRASR